MSTSVKFFHSGMPGALKPVTGSNSGGSDSVPLQRVLRQCLVTGFNTVSATGLVVSGEVATLSLPVGHGFEADCVALLEGVDQQELNGEWRVATSGANAVTFAAPGVADQIATGAITVKFAPAGWEEPFAGADSNGYRCFRSVNPTATGRYIRVGYAGANGVTCFTGYEAMTSSSAGTGWTASVALSYGGNVYVSVGGPWLVVADDKTFYVLNGYNNVLGVNNGGGMVGVGDFVSYQPGDSFNAVLAGNMSASASSSLTQGHYPLGYFGGTDVAPYCRINRSASGAPANVNGIVSAEAYFGGAAAGMSGATATLAGAAYPSVAGSLLLSRVLINEPAAGVRGHFRGLYATPHNIHASITQQTRFKGEGAFAGRTLMAVKPGATQNDVSMGLAFIDITGPWE